MAPKSMKSRRRKNLYKDFQKVKLKAGKTLPKGLNVTDASFKSRQIHLKEQLVRDASSEPKSHRQLSITTLLSQLEHYNMNIRRDAVLGLHQILQSAIATPPSSTPPTAAARSTNHSVVTTPPVLHQHLGPLVSRSAALVVDRETTVRQAALKLFQILLSVVPESQMTPFFKIVTAHLCCAMTHIEEQIQLDSLKFVDLLVEKYPGLVSESSAELLPNFISLIARRAQGQTVKSTLAINPGLKVHARKWRTSVLDRLFRVLNAVHEHCDVSGGDVNETANQIQGCGDVIHVDGINAVYHVIKDRRIDNDFKFSRDQTSNHGNVLAHAQSLREFVSGLVPLIVQSWVECTGALANNTDIDDTLLPTMAAVVKVTALLCRCIQGKDAVSMETKTGLVQQLFSMFPYEIEERKKKKSDKTEKISMTTLNLTICEILCHLTSSDDVIVWSALEERMTSYLTLVMNVKLQPADVMTLTSVIRLGLQNGRCEVQKFILSLLCGIYRRGQFASSQRRSLHDIMINIVIPRHDLISEPCIQDWLQSLPHLLLRTAQEALVRRSAAVAPLLYMMATLAPRKYELFSKSLDENSDAILDLVISTPLAPPDQRRFVELLYHVTSLHRDVIGKLYRFCCLATTDGDVINYLLNVIYSRLSRDSEYCAVADYLSLLMSLICVDGEDTEHCERLSQISADKLHLFPNTRQILQLFLSFIKQKQPQTFHCKTRVLDVLVHLVQRVERKKGSSLEKEKSQETLDSAMEISELPCEGLRKDSLEETFALVNKQLVTIVDLVEHVLWEEVEDEEKKELVKDRTVALLEYGDVYTEYISRLERRMGKDVGRMLRCLHDVVRPVTLKRNARRSGDRIRELMRESETSEDHHVTIRRQIEYELSFAAS